MTPSRVARRVLARHCGVGSGVLKSGFGIKGRFGWILGQHTSRCAYAGSTECNPAASPAWYAGNERAESKHISEKGANSCDTFRLISIGGQPVRTSGVDAIDLQILPFPS